MFRFFRSIRQQLLAENKTVKYAKYALGEILLIVTGILIAVQISNWNERRLDRIEERDILKRIGEDIQTDLANFPRRLGVVKSKEEALNRLAQVFKGNPIEDNSAFLSDIRQASSFGWGQPPIISQTFQEVVNSGKLGIVQDIALRNRIKAYYESARDYDNRSSLRVGEFVQIAYDLVPFQDVWAIKEGLTEEEYLAVVQRVIESNLSQHITREISRTSFLNLMWDDLTAQGNELLRLIETELNS